MRLGVLREVVCIVYCIFFVGLSVLGVLCFGCIWGFFWGILRWIEVLDMGYGGDYEGVICWWIGIVMVLFCGRLYCYGFDIFGWLFVSCVSFG